MEDNTGKHKKKSSLRVQIGLFYSLLAFVNIVFFSIMIFENQSDLLVRSFQLQSENLANQLVSDLGKISLDLDEEESEQALVSRMKMYEIQGFRILEENGNTVFLYPDLFDSSMLEHDKPFADIHQELDPQLGGSIFKSKYHLELREEDFSIIVTIPIPRDKSRNFYFQSLIRLSGIQEQLERIYYFMGLSMGWGILFHVLFAIFVYKVIFTRLNRLKEASQNLSMGDLTARARWKSRKKDELDELGSTFNTMAERIQETVQTITRLNFEINQELMIGREVQELFLPKMKSFKEYSIGRIYKPLREVGGDIYLFYKIQDKGKERLYFFIADASGHGVSAALVTVTMAVFLESILKEKKEPNEVIHALSDLIGSRMESSFFATGIFFSVEDNTMKVCNGGHNPPLILKKNNSEFIEIKSSGPPLGMVEDHNYETSTYNLETGDKIFAYTDCLVESLNVEGNMYGMSRVMDRLKNSLSNQRSNQEALDDLFSDLDEFTFEFKDDLTVLFWEIP